MQIWGHRGAYSEMPENTLHAFARAIELGATGVELDIHLAKDGEIVIIHDERIDRVSNGVGWVKDYTLQELKNFNFNKRQISEPKFMEIPTLREVLELLKPHKNITVNIEIKNNIIGYYLIEEKSLAVVKELGMLERVLFSSFNHFTMLIIKNIEPNAKTALLCGSGIITTAQECLALGAGTLNIDANGMRQWGIVDEAMALGIEINVWGITSAEDLLYAENKSVNAVIVNDIAYTKNVLTNTVTKNNSVLNGILCWYPFTQNSSILDLSNGLLTDMLKEKCSRILDENSNEKADYAIVYEPKEISKPFLQNLHFRLKPDGRFLLIFENPCGIEKMSRDAFSIENPIDRKQVKEMLSTTGFKKQKWYYPCSNHRNAFEIFSENALPNEFFANKPFSGISMKNINLLKNFTKIGIFENFCNSYLIEALASEKDENCETDYIKITSFRKTNKRFATIINSCHTVKKKALHEDAKFRLQILCENHKILEELGIAAIPVNLEANGNFVSMPKYAEPILWDYWLYKIKENNLNEDEFFSAFDYIRSSIFKVFDKTKKCFWELVPANAFYNETTKQITFFDQEFSSEDMDPNVAVARAIQAIKYQPLFDEWNKINNIYEKLKERYSIKENFGELLEIVHNRTSYVFSE
jgi:glycerophosphoryl diester phosphodiesterase